MNTKIDIISGFLGAGKTTLIKKLIENRLDDEKIIIIENEFGEVGIDGTLLKKSGLEVKEINSGCICCTLVGDFERSIREVLDRFKPDRIIIEPSGVAKLSEVIKACRTESLRDSISINMVITVVDINRFNLYISNFGEFFEDQIRYSKTILLSRVQESTEKKIGIVVDGIKRLNNRATIIADSWDKISGQDIFEIGEDTIFKYKRVRRISSHTSKIKSHSHHSANQVFQVWAIETSRMFLTDELKKQLKMLQDKEEFGIVLRGKGILNIGKDIWLQFDYIPSRLRIKKVRGDYKGGICVIGTGLKKKKLRSIFEN